ncbi:hypothetical protein P153DRAFT_381019 [Dothidotthia symphoricarpi CBS 119687]|uniref:Uncharacterized protein n=1 Tax=Dothidotthia symphoricarpi CBS 119687 TaxID=1392245 RepID=A0A6A6APC2_9PLEO|nr:uncharacterized protein P153DRAFT_381019 [Dothidotthia symphoricarpi CBS 119687]KAF2133842.1 hypothetical protein P153DRAFT_381019 [Dothidotthia symphoricarpi CBS 119687]
MAPPPSTSPAVKDSTSAEEGGLLAKGKKLLGLGKKREGEGHKQEAEKAGAMSHPTLLPSPALTTPSTDAERRASPRGSPRMHPVSIGASPSRRIRSSSPGLHSPASSQIFERNVQEPEESSAIPAHIKTEDFIPPALDASSLAITDSHLNPDEVEIVMHSAHQPASAVVVGGTADSPSLKHEESRADMTESATNYGLTDPHRLSFISFADVVQAEHIEHDREPMGSNDGLQFMSLDSTTADRSPSPVTSSSHSRNASPKGADYGRTRSPGSPTSLAPTTHDPSLGGELPLQIETMRQALRKTRSGDLSGPRSQAPSAVSLVDSAGA